MKTPIPLVEYGRLDPDCLPDGHPDKIRSGVSRLAADLGCSIGEAYKILVGLSCSIDQVSSVSRTKQEKTDEINQV